MPRANIRIVSPGNYVKPENVIHFSCESPRGSTAIISPFYGCVLIARTFEKVMVAMT